MYFAEDLYYAESLYFAASRFSLHFSLSLDVSLDFYYFFVSLVFLVGLWTLLFIGFSSLWVFGYKFAKTGININQINQLLTHTCKNQTNSETKQAIKLGRSSFTTKNQIIYKDEIGGM